MIVARTGHRVPLGVVAVLLLGLLFHVVGPGRVTYIVTNQHVAAHAKLGEKQALSVLLSRDGLVLTHLVWVAANKALAIVRSTEPLGKPAVQLADTASVIPGGQGRSFAASSASRGDVSRSTPGRNGVRHFQQIAASLGNSTGPVYGEARNIIGVNRSKASITVPFISGEKGSLDEPIASGEGMAAAVDTAELDGHI
jgi:hypothetical protein